jgi:hypothetical protein
MKKIFDIDCLGMCASILCLIHCLCLPWLIAIAGVYFGSFFESPNFHNIMLVVAILIGLPVFILSFVRYKSKLILITGVVGLSLTTFGTMKSESCCPSVSSEKVCDESTECSSECSEEVCEESTECSSEEVCEESTDCGSECSEEQELVEADNNSDETVIQSMNTVPLGVCLLIFAHFLNFRKRKSCKNVCCS